MNSRFRMNGMTLIELMTVIVVLAIVTTFAVNSYRGYLIRANRTEATMALLRLQAAQEKFFLQNNRYATTAEMAVDPPGGLGIAAVTNNGMYTIAIANPDAVSYVASATATGTQTADNAACHVYTISDTGARTPATDTHCWR